MPFFFNPFFNPDEEFLQTNMVLWEGQGLVGMHFLLHCSAEVVVYDLVATVFESILYC